MARRDRTGTSKKTVCVVGTDEFNLALIARIPESENWDIIPVLHRDDVQPSTGIIDFDGLYQTACDIIDALDSPPNAIIGHLDFPVTSLVSLLNRHYELPAASPEAVARCENKYWMRQEQRAVLPDQTPEVRAVNPFDPEAAMKQAPPYPFWLKPVKGHSSALGFLIGNDQEFHEALHKCRQFIHVHGVPFNRFLAHLDLPELKKAGLNIDVDGNFAVAESLISSDRLFTFEGFVRRGETVIYGVVESLRDGRAASSLSRYHYPADLDLDHREKGCKILEKVLKRFGFDNGPFNAEFFLNSQSGDLALLEINPRISKSHSPLFHMVDGASHHRQAIRLALGLKPPLPDGSGRHAMASKFMIRSTEGDGIVKRVPTKSEIEELRRILPDFEAAVLVNENDRLSDLPDQDSYSYEIMDVFLGGNSHDMIEDAYHRCRDSLEIHIKPMPVKD